MEYDPFSEKVYDRSSEVVRDALFTLEVATGFERDERFALVEHALVETMRIGEDSTQLMEYYDGLIQEIVEKKEGSAYTVAQIGGLIRKATIRFVGGKTQDYIKDLRDIATYSHNIRLEQVEYGVEWLLSGEVAATLSSYAEFDSETLTEVAGAPFDEAFEMAYGYLIQAGYDPDEIIGMFHD